MKEKSTLDIKIIVAAHKNYWMPNDHMYIPVHVGAKGKEEINGYARDDSGDNISELNPRYSELTGLYWAWKNLDYDYLGLCHYRRYFAGSGDRGILNYEDATRLLNKAPLVLPRKRNYFIWSVQGHYDTTMLPGQIDILRSVLSDMEPNYVIEFERRMKMRSAHILNMMIARNDIMDSYLSWLFPILKELEMRIDFSEMTSFEMRCIGRLSERLLDTWLAINHVQYIEQPLVSLEKTNLRKKCLSFMEARLFGKRYEASF